MATPNGLQSSPDVTGLPSLFSNSGFESLAPGEATRPRYWSVPEAAGVERWTSSVTWDSHEGLRNLHYEGWQHYHLVPHPIRIVPGGRYLATAAVRSDSNWYGPPYFYRHSLKMLLKNQDAYGTNRLTSMIDDTFPADTQWHAFSEPFTAPGPNLDPNATIDVAVSAPLGGGDDWVRVDDLKVLQLGTSYHYDASGRLAEVQLANGSRYRMNHDRLGRLVETEDAEGRTTRFTYDTLDRLTRVQDAQGNTYGLTYDAVGNLVSFVEGADPQSDPVTGYAYDEYGGSSSSGTAYNPQRLAFAHFDTDTGLCYVRRRYLATDSGRFLSRDPLQERQDLHPYVYARNNPTTNTDPEGMDTWTGNVTGGGGMAVITGHYSYVGWLKNECTGQWCKVLIECTSFGLGLGGSFGSSAVTYSGPRKLDRVFS